MTAPPLSSRVTAVKTTEVDTALATLVLAFATDPAARWTWPRPDDFLRHLPALSLAFGSQSFALGTADQVDNFGGVALWLPPGVGPDEAALSRLIESTIPADILQDAGPVFEQMAHYHPKEPHWYLPMIGVDPVRQGQRFGERLMAHALERCDATQHLAYLESSNPRNRPFYERLGFTALGSIQHGSSPTIVPMLRKPRPGR